MWRDSGQGFAAGAEAASSVHSPNASPDRAYEVIEWRALSPADRGAWNRFRAERSALASPYFDLAWFDALAAVRSDLKVLVMRSAGAPIAFLPHHRSRLGVALPAAEPLADWHGVVSGPAHPPLAEALEAAGLVGFAFRGAPEDGPAAGGRPDTSHVIDLTEGHDAWRAARGRALQGTDRNRKKVVKDGGVLSFTFDDAEPSTLETLLRWKSAQLKQSGQSDIFALKWLKAFIEQLLRREAATAPLGLISSLRLNGALAAAHLGLRSGGVLHYWFPAYDPALSRYSPGALLLDELARAAPAEGVERIDLGRGDYRYKREFANHRATLVDGFAPSSGVISRVQHAAHRFIVEAPEALPSRAWRKMGAHRAWRRGEAHFRAPRSPA